jgi:hypothetical protein
MPPPIVYCETNWLVALAFPHHKLFKVATRLLNEARAGACSLRVPLAAFLEARHPLDEVSTALIRSFSQVRDDVARAYQNGHAQFKELHEALQSNGVDHYAQRDTLPILDALQQDPAISVLAHSPQVISTQTALRTRVHLRGKDVVDLYMLATIIADRRTAASGPAVFFSSNWKEFLRDARVPEQIYIDEKILCRDDFDLSPALGAWRAKYERVPGS